MFKKGSSHSRSHRSGEQRRNGRHHQWRKCQQGRKDRVRRAWIFDVHRAASPPFGFWNFNSTDQIDTVPIANNTGSGWQALGGTVPAPSFAVYGK